MQCSREFHHCTVYTLSKHYVCITIDEMFSEISDLNQFEGKPTELCNNE